MSLRGARIHVTGVVQGVGFRPFVYGLAKRLALSGWVRNTSAGVDIEVDGSPESLAAFVESLRSQAPPLARIDAVQVQPCSANGFAAFEIVHSESLPGAFQPISPDVSVCADCLHELFDPSDRRYRYPFINCTHCGPRFTIIKDIPYDRPLTTMARFDLCPDCAAGYADPLDRRFHAQPVACPACGPKVRLETTAPEAKQSGVRDSSNLQSLPRPRSRGARDGAISNAQHLLTQGRILAVKGLGGFHLACDATNAAAVAELRQRKGRIDKPFALMMPDVETVERYCVVTEEERALLQSPQRPIVLLKRRPVEPPLSDIPESVAPGQSTLGVMLPYTPLHYLLFDSAPGLHALVMTSGNFSEEPIAIDNDDALARLSPLADAFLLHDRDIHIRCDDSVVRIFAGRELPIRRSRGYAPYPVRLPFDAPPVLAAGAELKNTFCLTCDGYAFLSQHIGDLENYETLRSFEDGVSHFERLFRIRPERIAYDWHPDYLATRYALERAEREGLRAIGVQHHHAHVAACMAENGLTGDRPVIGVAFDGTGYGTDGAIWGGEFFVADYRACERVAHLAYVPLPGGDAAARNPYRIALAHLRQAGVEWTGDLPPVAAAKAEERRVVARQIALGFNAPPTSSMGRLFDAVASIAGVRQSVTYEGQAAIELEAVVDSAERDAYRFDWPRESIAISAAPAIRAIVDDVRAGAPASIVSARFHNGLAAMVRDVCALVSRKRGLNEVALSGGVFQNVTLLARTLDLLRAEGLTVYTHHLVPPNDGGLSLGQAMVAASR